ncbi:MAG: C39 family peptidase [Anaerolineae bacterium]
MKKLLITLLLGVFALSFSVLSFGVYKYGSVAGLTRRAQVEIASLRPKPTVIVPTFVPEATVDTAAFMADLATSTPVVSPEPISQATPVPTSTEESNIVSEPTLQPTAEPTLPPTATHTITPTPIYSPEEAFVNLTGYRHNWQTWNNCGPATIATYLSYLGKGVTQAETAEVLKPNESDKNVRVDEIVSYVESRFPDLIVTPLINGSPETMRLLLSNNFPVMLQTWLEEDVDDGMGHFRFLVGYDDQTAEWIVSDSYVSEGVDSPYAGIRIDNDRFVDHWLVFDNIYILIYKPEDGPLIDAIIGEDLNPEVNQANALADYTERLQTEGDNPFVWHTMGDLLLVDGRPEQAAQAYDQARTIGLPWRMFWYSFGVFEAYVAVERYEDVIALADATIESGGPGEEVYYWKGIAHRALGEEAEAQDAFRQALWWNPSHQASKDALNSG